MSKKILVVDDEQEVAALLINYLKEQGFVVETAADGHAGLEKAREIKPDVVILDVMLPKMNGYEVCRLLKYDNSFANIRIIMCTSRSEEKDLQTGHDVGADAYIPKPYKLDEILATINKFITS